jgi:putative transposase
MTKLSPFRYFKTSPEVIRLAVMMYVRFPLSLRNVEDLLHERRIEISHETVRYWWNRFGPMFAAQIRRKRVDRMRAFSNWHNLFNHDRSLSRRSNFKLNRTAALEEWRQLCVA